MTHYIIKIWYQYYLEYYYNFHLYKYLSKILQDSQHILSNEKKSYSGLPNYYIVTEPTLLLCFRLVVMLSISGIDVGWTFFEIRDYWDGVSTLWKERISIMARRFLMAEVNGGRVRGRPRLGWMDGVKVALGNRGMTMEAARQCAKDREEWRALVHK